MDILLIEDNEVIIKGLVYSFSKSNYHLVFKKDLQSAKCYLERQRVSLVILDMMLPDGDGLDFFQEYLKPRDIKTIFLTAKDDEDIVASSLEMGADDYLTKPFSTKELLARINKILKQNKIIKVKDIVFDLDKMVVKQNERVIPFTSIELKLLSLLFTNLNKVVRRGLIIDTIFDATGNDVDDHTVTVYLQRIREKLGTSKDIITTIKGVGYRIDEE